MNDMNSTLKKIILNEEVTTLFQPIFTLYNGEILGYEALSRGPINTPFHSPIALIEAAEDEGCIWDLEMLFRKKAIEKAASIPNNKMLFLNVDPNVIKEPSYTRGFTKKHLDFSRIDSKNIVFEITERTAIDDYPTFRDIINNYKSQNYKIAIDDVGSGYSGLKTITELQPEYVKIDMDLIRDIDTDPFKKSIVKGLVSMANDVNFKLIAEGVETINELKTLVSLGVNSAQGFFLAKPTEKVNDILPEIRDLILRLNKDAIDAFSYDSAYYCVGKISKQQKTYSKSLSCHDIKMIFDQTNVESICLTSDFQYPDGLIMKNFFNSKLADRYGYNLYSQRAISLLMDSRPLSVDYYTPVTNVLTLAMQRQKSNLYDDIIVTQCSKFYGITTLYDLIRNSTDYEKMYARQLNPLTSLPGNIIIRQLMSQYISNGNTVGILYIDLDHFKAYNDVFGFEKGDQVIKTTAEIITEIISSYGQGHFIGHIGGDDFFALIKGNHDLVSKICQRICTTFDRHHPVFFEEDILRTGTYVSKDRNQDEHTFALNTISIAGYYGTLAQFKTPELLGAYMSKIKREVKNQEGSVYQLVI